MRAEKLIKRLGKHSGYEGYVVEDLDTEAPGLVAVTISVPRGWAEQSDEKWGEQRVRTCERVRKFLSDNGPLGVVFRVVLKDGQ